MEGNDAKFEIGKRIYFKDKRNGKEEFSRFVEKQIKKKDVANIEIILAIQKEFGVSMLEAEDALNIYKDYIQTAKKVYQK